MADPEVSHSSSADEDQDFDPSSGDVTMQEMDDERTLDEEEALSNEDSVANELDDLHKESEIPVEVLLAMYGYSDKKQASSSSSSSYVSSRVESSQCPNNNEDNSNSNNDINNDNVTATITTTNTNSNTNDDDNLPSSSSSSFFSNHPSSSTTHQHQDNNNNMGDNEVNTNNNNNNSMTNDSDISQNENSQGDNSNQISSEIKSSSSTTPSASTPPSSSSHNNATLTSTSVSSFGNIGASSEARENCRDGGLGDKTTGSDVVGSSNGAGLPPSTADLLSSDLMDVASDDDEDYDPEQEEEDWKKSVSVGVEFQAMVPDFPSKDEDYSGYNMEDRILWSPDHLNEADVEAYLLEVHRQHQLKSNNQPPNKNLPTGAPARDDEQALYLLYQCNNNFEEALRRQRLQALPQPDPMSLWTEEECRSFETGLRLYGKDFFLNQQKVKTRSVREIVQFYYLWKKTERHDAFAARTRMEKKKYNLHPGVTDYMDRFISEFETPLVDTSSNSIGNSINHHHHHNNKHCILTSEMVRRMDASKHSSMPFAINNYMEAASNDASQCCDGLMVYCNIPSGVSCSYDDANSASSLFPQSYNNSNNCHLLPNDVSSTANFFASSIYEYPITSASSVNNHLPSCSGLPSSYHLDHLPPQPDLTCYPSQVDSTYIPVATQVFGGNMCASPTSLSFHANPGYYPVVDSSPSSFPNKQGNDCLMPEVDMDSLIASSQMSSVVGPQELSISEINMIFGNVERPSCDLSGAVNSNNMAASNSRGGDMMGAGDASGFAGVSCLASSSDTPTFLPPSMQKLCSDDGVGATLESISASIQELVGPENTISPENLLSVLEGNSINSSSNPSSSSVNVSSSPPINTSASSSTTSTSNYQTPAHLLPSTYSSDDKISSCSGLNFNNNHHHHPANNHLESSSNNSIDNNNPFYNTQHHTTHLAESSSNNNFSNDIQHPTNSIPPNVATNRYNNNNNNNNKSNFSVSSSNLEATPHASLHNEVQQSSSPHPPSQQQQPSQSSSSSSSPLQSLSSNPPHPPSPLLLNQHPPPEHSIEASPPPHQSSSISSHHSPPTPHHTYQPSHIISSSATSNLLIDPPHPSISSDFSKTCSDSASIKS